MRIPASVACGLLAATIAGAVFAQNYPAKGVKIVVDAAPGLHVFDTNAYSSSLTAGLTEALQQVQPQTTLLPQTFAQRFLPRRGEKQGR